MEEVIRTRVTVGVVVAAAVVGCALLPLLALDASSAYVRSPHPSDRLLIDNLRLHGAYYRALVAEKRAERHGADAAGRVWIEESDREWGEGIVTRTTKGYVYSKEAAGPLVDSLDGFTVEDDVFAYRKIEGNWYLYHHASVDKPE